jgi:hypothetical protein
MEAETLYERVLLAVLLFVVFIILVLLLPYMVITRLLMAPVEGFQKWWFFMYQFIRGFLEALSGRRYMAKF